MRVSRLKIVLALVASCLSLPVLAAEVYICDSPGEKPFILTVTRDSVKVEFYSRTTTPPTLSAVNVL
jgi:hypothetical protein